MHDNARGHDVVAKLVPGGDCGLAHLSDSELLANTRTLVGRSNQLFAALLAHLAEVEARGLHRTRACASLYTYCIYELRFSEDAAARRAGAAKLVKRFPLLLGAIANGELHLTGLLMLGPHLTQENLVKVLGRAKFRTKKELAKLVRELHPLPLVPDVIEPLCLERAPLRRPTWQEFVSSFAPAVRELPLGERPGDWANDVEDVEDAHSERARHANEQDAKEFGTGERDVDASASFLNAPARADAPRPDALHAASDSHAPARCEALGKELPPVTGPQQYSLQFSTTEEHVQLIERAKALLAREARGKSLGELHLQAMKLLVAALEKQKFAVTERPRNRRQQQTTEHREKPLQQRQEKPQRPAQAPAMAPDTPDTSAAPVGPASVAAAAAAAAPRPRSRHVPATVRREVFQRDDGRCSYVDERGERCRETRCLELHHRQPFGRDGDHAASNLTLHCPAHNALAAELDFGRQYMAERRELRRHESRASEERALAGERIAPR